MSGGNARRPPAGRPGLTPPQSVTEAADVLARITRVLEAVEDGESDLAALMLADLVEELGGRR